MMNKVHVKNGDTVVLRVGKPSDKYSDVDKKTLRTGKVVAVSPKEGKVIVEGVNVAQKHKKPRRQGEEGGIIKMETPIYACKVMRVCPKCSKPTKAAFKFLEDGSKVRVCKKCGETI